MQPDSHCPQLLLLLSQTNTNPIPASQAGKQSNIAALLQGEWQDFKVARVLEGNCTGFRQAS